MSQEQIKTHKTIVLDEESKNFKRLDQYLKHILPEYSRTYIKKIFLEGFIEADCELLLKKMPPVGTTLELQIPYPEDYFLEPEDIALEVLFEDEHLIIINKQAGIVVHPAPGNWTGTLVNALLHHCKDLKGIGDSKRPGIVHRLDKGTTGVMVMAKDQKTHELLSDIFKRHDIKREYLALCLRQISPKSGTLKSLIARNPHNKLKMTSKVQRGKEAITHFQVQEYFENFSYVKLTLETGRTHQIRVHLSELKKAPIVNDHTYANPKQQFGKHIKFESILKDYPHPLLHAHLLEFTHPITKKLLSFRTPPNSYFQKALQSLREES